MKISAPLLLVLAMVPTATTALGSSSADQVLTTPSNTTATPAKSKEWIRGVNIGGWLVLERFITPYLFAITDCHTKGDLCWYPGQLSAPQDKTDDERLCQFHCKPHLQRNPDNNNKEDYPWDEWTLMEAFARNPEAGIRWLDHHYDTFVTREDITKLKEAGVTHVRVPLPHWILQEEKVTIVEGKKKIVEPWLLTPSVWLYFVRFVGWCREAGIDVWPDLHTAPGSQNGFDNSGRLNLKVGPTCMGWASSKENVRRTLESLKAIVGQIVKDGLADVVTGFGILNEPFMDCPLDVVKDYNNRALKIVRDTIGVDTHVYVGDLFNSTIWNDGTWWANSTYENTYLDSHYYHVFADEPRSLSPRQHIAYVCQKNGRDTIGCCYENEDKEELDSERSSMAGKTPVSGISRMVGEWSAAYDTLVVARLDDVVMRGIKQKMVMPMLDRTFSPKEKAFLENFVKAQMVTYEAADVGVSSGWFYWTLKMEGGPFAEWDFLRGLEEGWIPSIPTDRSKTSEELYGTCADIIFRTDDGMDIIHPFPDPDTLDPENWQGVNIDDDVVVSHGKALLKPNAVTSEGEVVTNEKGVEEEVEEEEENKDGKTKPDQKQHDHRTHAKPPVHASKDASVPPPKHKKRRIRGVLLPFLVLAFFVYAVKRVFFDPSPFHNLPCDRPSRSGYSAINTLAV